MKFCSLTFLFALLTANATFSQPEISGSVSTYQGITTFEQELIRSTSALHIKTEEQNFDYGYLADLLLEIDHHNPEDLDPFIYLNELYGAFYFENADISIGKKQMNWGRSETNFVTNVYNPLYLRHAFSASFANIQGAPFVIRGTYFAGDHTFDAAISPVFNQSILPDTSSSWIKPLLNSFPIPANLVRNREVNQPDLKESLQAALRYGYRSISWDADLYLSYWLPPQQRFYKQYYRNGIDARFDLYREYDRSIMTGFSTELRTQGSFIFKAEGLYNHSAPFDYLPQNIEAFNADSLTIGDLIAIDDTLSNNNNGFIKRKQNATGMVGVVYQEGSIRLSLEWVSDLIYDYEDVITRDKWAHSLGLLYVHSFGDDNYRFQLFSQWDVSNQNYWINPALSWNGLDNVEISTGFHFLAGKKPSLNETEISFSLLRSKSLFFFEARWFWQE
jgi:hypothetical protein